MLLPASVVLMWRLPSTPVLNKGGEQSEQQASSPTVTQSARTHDKLHHQPTHPSRSTLTSSLPWPSPRKSHQRAKKRRATTASAWKQRSNWHYRWFMLMPRLYQRLIGRASSTEVGSGCCIASLLPSNDGGQQGRTWPLLPKGHIRMKKRDAGEERKRNTRKDRQIEIDRQIDR